MPKHRVSPPPRIGGSPRRENIDPLLVFDDKCLMCNRFIMLLVKSIPTERKFFVSSMESNLAKLRMRSSDEAFNRDALVLFANGEVIIGAQAVFRAFSYSRNPYRLLRLLEILPKHLTELVYDFFAARRRRIPDTCPFPDESIRRRIIY
jgi:predicted DCC family thiol-disulfide oxidoreductase YuxK